MVIPNEVNLYGFNRDIRCYRCYRCYKFRRSYSWEWSPADNAYIAPPTTVSTAGPIVPNCANPACEVITLLLRRMTYFIEDVEEDLWFCLYCDWMKCESLFDDGAYEEIPHYRYNLPSCVSYGRFHTYLREWVALPAGDGYLCGYCADVYCANQYCITHIMEVAKVRIWCPEL
jgi:hypothetical protein